MGQMTMGEIPQLKFIVRLAFESDVGDLSSTSFPMCRRVNSVPAPG